ncbi:FecR family protein [Flavivirga amylovorans]|uniref:FecR family protein n=1 Tax=Flavivirga amylovorans TaxID=870486 RepID=A0ABT8X1K5_9FLAO|nr:FecR family protein [Flavivirga amylovorans]MDO5987809.1 FecR family protein [Flavivirga amylovorans]
MKSDINKDNFLGKWLSGDLSNEERKTFEESEDYIAYNDILRGVERLSRPVFDIEKGLKEQKIYNASYKEPKTSKVIKLRTWMYRVAAVVLLIFGLKTLFFQDVTIRTEMAQTQVITLPDNSVVTLNAGSSLKYDKDSFIENRVLRLKGEAFFDVSKGSTFTVTTKNGKITVLGTEFNVYSRDRTLEVHCFEGKVRIKKETNEVILTQGKGARSNEKEHLSLFEITNSKPDWLDGKSSFYEVPLEQLIKELERQYNIKIHKGNVDVKRIFTGFFNHTNLETALLTSFDPMNISYTFESQKIIVLKNK